LARAIRWVREFPQARVTRPAPEQVIRMAQARELAIRVALALGIRERVPVAVGIRERVPVAVAVVRAIRLARERGLAPESEPEQALRPAPEAPARELRREQKFRGTVRRPALLECVRAARLGLRTLFRMEAARASWTAGVRSVRSSSTECV
jgi:hypothetical protein